MTKDETLLERALTEIVDCRRAYRKWSVQDGCAGMADIFARAAAVWWRVARERRRHLPQPETCIAAKGLDL